MNLNISESLLYLRKRSKMLLSLQVKSNNYHTANVIVSEFGRTASEQVPNLYLV